MLRVILSLAVAVFAIAPASAQKKVTVTGGNDDLTNVVLNVPVDPQAIFSATMAVLPDGTKLPAGLARERSATDAGNLFYLPKIKAGETVTVTLVNDPVPEK